MTELGVVPLEHFMSVGARVRSFGDTAEAVEIELTLKGCELMVLFCFVG